VGHTADTAENADTADAEATVTDALIVGAGPVGLFQVFELGLLGMTAQVVDTLPHAGGQCAALYGDKPIYDIPGLPFCTGQELTDRLLQQIRPFAAGFHLGQEVADVHQRDDGRFAVATSTGARFVATVVIVAGGVGSFRPRTLKIDGLAKYEGTQLFHHAVDPSSMVGERVVVVGAGEEALALAVQCASEGAQRAASVLLLHRRDDFRASPATLAQFEMLREAGRIQFIAGQVTGLEESPDRLRGLLVQGSDGSAHTVPVDRLLVCLGLSPQLGPIAHWGLGLDRKQVNVDTEKFQTSTPGIFAVGDINVYPGKKKLILCGFHEATLAAYGAAQIVFPGRDTPLLYTTSSSQLHRRLGVTSPDLD